MGFDGFWLPENHFTGPFAIPAPLMLLAGVAARTSTIKLGTTSYLLPIRHPVLAAEEVAVLDRMSGGRVILGIGRGFADVLFATFDIPVKDKRKRFKANLETMMTAWRGEPVHHHNDEPVILAPLPIQQPHPPLWVAAFGPLAIKQAGQLGFPYIASPVETLETLKDNIEQHRGHVSEAGLPPTDITPIMRTVFVSNAPHLNKTVKEAIASEPGRGRSEESTVDDWAIVGEPGYVRDQIAEYQERLGMDYLIARGRIRGISEAQQLASHDQLMILMS